MSLELSSIVFKSDTTQLQNTITVLNQVKSAVAGLEATQNKAAISNSRADKAAASAAREQAQSALAAIKLEKEKQKAIEASADATVSAGNRSISVLEKQEQVLQFMVQGYSRGQSSILATAKAAGAATDELAKLGSTLQSQRTLMGSDPFDKSLGALRALKNEFSVVKEQVRLYNAELGLTKKQSEDLARDKLRLIEASKIEGKSLFSVRDSVKELNMEYIRLAKSENDLVSQYKQNVKNTQDTAKANSYLETELQKVRFAVDEQNASMNRGSANALVRFENALKKSGKTAAEQKILLDEYRKSLEKLQTAGAGRATDYISRAVGPQLTDIIVGLSTGQSLMTVMMQQGGQLRDQFAMMGVAGAEMGQVMRTALSSMAVSVKDTAKAFGQLFIGGIVDAGKAAVNFVSNITGLNAALDLSKRYFAAMGEEGFKYIGMMNKMGAVTSVFAGILMATGVGALVALGVAAYQTMKEQDKLAESLALYNGTLSISHNSSLEYVAALNKMGVTTGNASAAIMAMAKSGVFASDEIMLVAKSAATMADYSSVSVEDTIKVFAKLKEKPVEALLDVAKQTGMVSLETIKMVEELQKSGKAADASALAMQTYGDVTAKQVQQMKDNYSSFGLFVMELGKTIKQFFSETFKDLFYTSTSGLQKEADKLQALVDKYEQASTTGRVAMGDAFGYTNDANKARLNQLREQISQMKLQNAAIEDQNKAKSEAARIEEVLNKAFDKTEDSLDKQLKKTQTLSQWQDFYLNKKLEQYAKDAGVNKEAIKLTEDQIKQTKALAKAEWDRAQKKGGSKQENYFETLLRSVTNEAIGAEAAQDKLTKAYTKMLELAADPRFSKLTEDQKARVMNILNEAHNTELATEANKRYAEGQELINKLLGKGEGLGKDYYASMAKLEALKGVDGFDVKEIEAAQKALQATTPYAKAMAEWFKEGQKAISDYRAKFKDSTSEMELQNKELDYQYSLLGLTEDQQKKLTIEYQRQLKIQKEQTRYDAARVAILNDDKLKTDKDRFEALGLLEQEHADKVRLINAETAYQYASEMQRQFNEIRDGISGSIVEALFNGGKAGTQKLRNFLVEQLKKPVTLVVNAVVNTLLGSVIGGLTGGSAASTAGNLGGIGNLLGGLGSLGSTIAGGIGSLVGSVFGTGVGNVALGTSLGLGASSSAAAASAAAAAGGASTAGISSAGSLFSSIGSAMPWIGGALAIMSLLGGLDDSGTYHTGGAARYSSTGGLTSGNSGAAYNFGFGQVETGASTITAMETLSKGLVNIFDGIAKTFGQTAGYEVATAFADDTSKDGAWGALSIALGGKSILNWNDFRQSKWAPKEFGDGEEGYKQYLAAVAKDTRQVLLDMDLPSWADKILTDLGDSASMESLTTAVQQIGTIKTVFDTMKNTLVELSGATDETMAALMELAGGIDTLGANATAYYQNFYTAEEQRANIQKQLTSAFKGLGLAMIDIDATNAREQFRALVESQDLTTESGRKAYTALLALASTFAGVTTAAEDAADSAADLEQAWKDAASAAYDVLEKAIQAQISILNEQATASEATISKLRGIFDLLKSSISDLYGEVSSTAAMQASQGYQVISSAISTGNLPAQSDLSSAISAVRSGISGTDFVSQFEADKARLQFAADLNTLLGQTEQQLSTEELTLKAIKDQIAMLELTLANAKAQLDAINGVNSSVLSVADAIRAFQEALIPTAGTGTSTTPIAAPSGGSFSSGSGAPSSGGYSVIDEIKNFYNQTLDPEQLKMQMWLRGWSIEDMATAADVSVDWAKSYLGIPAFATGGDYKGGLALVGEEGPEMINFNQGGRVYNADQTASMMSGGVDTVTAIQSLETRVDNLNYALQAIAINTSKTAKVLERVTPDGDTILVSGTVTVA